MRKVATMFFYFSLTFSDSDGNRTWIRATNGEVSIDDRLKTLNIGIESSNTKAPPPERYACPTFPRFFDDSSLLARMHFFASFCIIDGRRYPIRSHSTTSFRPDRLLRVFRPSFVPIYLRHSFDRSPISALINRAPLPPPAG
jgi:hypothetical protein